MEIEIIAAAEQTVSRWSGGRTRELYLSPAGASYKERDFRLRLSTAAVTAAASVFTVLPAYNRWLMPLTGTVELQHGSAAAVALGPGAVDAFAGGTATTSRGRCRDFNVMLDRTDRSGVILAALSDFPCAVKLQSEDFFYQAEGTSQLQLEDVRLQLRCGTLVRIAAAGILQLQGQGLVVHVGLTV